MGRRDPLFIVIVIGCDEQAVSHLCKLLAVEARVGRGGFDVNYALAGAEAGRKVFSRR